MSKIAISVGDVNGVGLEIILRAHEHIVRFCEPVYCAHREVIESASKLLGLEVASDMVFVGDFERMKGDLIEPGKVSAKSGRYSFESFMQGVKLTESHQCQALLTLPIHKQSWHLAGIESIGHTHVLSSYFGVDSIMMLGCDEMFVAFFSDHIPLRDVSERITTQAVYGFLMRFATYENLQEPCCVLGCNPHCGDEGLMGGEDQFINEAVKMANDTLQQRVFFGAYPADSAFSPFNRQKFRYFVSMYHDVGLAPLKALYFEQSINVTLGLPILRTSVDHGVAFDKAYKNDQALSTQSYLNALRYAIQKIGA